MGGLAPLVACAARACCPQSAPSDQRGVSMQTASFKPVIQDWRGRVGLFGALRVAGLMLWMAAIACLSGCGGGGYGGPPPPQSNPSPSLAMGSLNPSSAVAGGGAFALTVTGSNFVNASTVQWNGTARATTFVSGTSLQATITTADIAAGGTALVTVSTPAPGGGISGGLSFTIDNPMPTATSLGPNAVFAGDTGFS